MRIKMLGIFVFGLFLISACNTESETSFDFHSLDYLTLSCMWHSACTGSAMEDCLEHATSDDLAGDYRAFQNSVKSQYACFQQAKSCDDYQACGVLTCDQLNCEADGLHCDDRHGGARCVLPEYSCSNLYGEEICVDGIMTFCTEGMYYDDAPPVAFKCANLDMVCGEMGCVDETFACASGQTHYCDGPYVVRCRDGESSHIDCRFVAEDFVCEPLRFGDDLEQPTCQMPTEARECEPEFEATCEGDVVIACAAGKLVELDCSRVGAACVEGACQTAEGD